jgi:fused signal recognition particle receptor
MIVDLTMIILLVTLVALVIMLIMMQVSSRNKADTENVPSAFEGTSGLRGKVEKLEARLNDLQTEHLRAIEFTSKRFDAMQLLIERGGAQQSGDRLELPEPLAPVELQLVRTEVAVELSTPEETSELQENEVAAVELPEAISSSDEQQDEPPVDAAAQLKQGLSKTRIGFFGKLKSLFLGKTTLSSDQLEEAEALLIGSDLGVNCTGRIIEALKIEAAKHSQLETDAFQTLLKAELLGMLGDSSRVAIAPEKVNGEPKIVLVVGVNGVGKTTSVAKLANSWKKAGAKVLLIAADTFRAAAVEQLQSWGVATGVDVFAAEESQKPAAVVFDGLVKARAENFDIVLIDTAGRLHNKANLMQELDGIGNVIRKFNETGPNEVLLVVDACTGQNALSQAKDFNEIIKLTGIVITKLDGTPKGGIVVAIKHELGVPVRYIGVGEGKNDLQIFDSERFVTALLSSDSETFQPEEKVSVNAERRRMRRSE